MLKLRFFGNNFLILISFNIGVGSGGLRGL